MASITEFASHTNYNLESRTASEISERLKSMEVQLFEELSNSYLELHQQADYDIDSLRNVAQIQCALDIVQSAKTTQEQATVYDILQQLKQPVPG